ncbi:MAG TPA: PilZ domain-containing protein [Terriglobales bacterium]|nr:PilZ domain-containing protein [Terriglobales bacterium]
MDGIECLKGPGEILQITYKRKTAKFRVMWVGAPGSKEHGHIGVRTLEPRKNIWSIKPVPDAAKSQIFSEPSPPAGAGAAPSPPQSSNAEPITQPEKRRYTRHRCLGSVEFRIAGNCTTMSGKLTNISLGGCHIQAPGICLPGTLLELALDACNQRIHLDGRVMIGNPANGMGVEFVSGCEGLKHLPRFIEVVRRHATALPVHSRRVPKPAQRTSHQSS